jgi:predicted short-subunit dehydrogenase-like oxidoreductase (DUF2520 family)
MTQPKATPTRRPLTLERVFVFGAGKVGAGLTRAMRAVGLDVTLRPQRRGLPKRPIDADLVVLAIRDRDLASTAEAIAQDRLLKLGARKVVAVVHCAGALGPSVLAALRAPGVAVAQMHPMISFATPAFTPSLARGQLHVDGDPAAMRLARALGKRLGMTPRTIAELDHVAYHAAAGLVANGAAALVAAGIDLLERAGVEREQGAAMMGPLLRSVAENVDHLGMPAALTGPVRRGDAVGIERHLATLTTLAPDLVPLYLAAARVQLPLARVLGEGPREGFDAIAALVDRCG